MKRSRKITLGLMATSAVALSACGGEEEVEGKLYRTLDQCLNGGDFQQEQCETAFTEAQQIHETSSPRYNSENLCEDEFGLQQCEYEENTGGGYWSPFLTGYMVSSFLNSSSRRSYYSRPFYRTRKGGFFTSGGAPIWMDSKGAKVAKSSLLKPVKPAKIRTKASVVARGGFGSRSSSRSSWGG